MRLTRRRSAARRVVAQVCALALVAIVGVGVVLVGTTTATAAGTTLVSESFTGATVADPNFIGLNTACLTKATATAAAGTLAKCATTNGPVPLPADNGWLRLTDSTGFVQGGVVYNRAVPAAAGLVVTFDQAQYGGTPYTGSAPPATGDGIGFFLSDGTYNLSTTGAYGGALGYAQRSGTGSGDAPGAVGGYLGVGLDVYGNYSNDQEGRGTGCNAAAGTRTSNAVVLRGPGRSSGTPWTTGYCRIAASNQLSPAYNTPPSLYYASTVAPTPTTENLFVRHVRVTVDAQDASSTTGPRVTVELMFPGETAWGHATTTVMPTRAPATYKFGWAASTGGATDIHLIRNVAVSSLLPLSDLTLSKQVAGTVKDKYLAGDIVPYQFLVYNTGTAALTGVAVADPRITPVACPATTLAAGASMTCTGSYTVTAADVAAGPTLTNTATARGTLPGGAATTSQPSSVTIPLQNIPRITLIKTPSRTSGVAVGDAIAYTFLVTNTGNVPVTTPTVVDGTTTYTCPAATLAAGVSTTCVGPTRTVTQANVDAGQVTNTATASATYTSGTTTTTVTDSDTVVVPTFVAAPALALTKSATPPSGVAVGAVIRYAFSVMNTGNVTITGVGVTDGTTVYTCTSTTLAPFATTACTAPTHTVTQADVDAGSVTNTATASGKAAGGAAVTSPPSTVTVPTVTAAPGLAIVKTATPSANVRVGDVISYSFKVTNSGNVTVSSVAVSDGTVSYPCTPASLAPSASTTTCPGPTHTVTQSDVDAGHVLNTATATGATTKNAPVASTPTTVDVSTAVAAPSLSLVKSAAPRTNVAVGDSVAYSFVVTNNGNVTIASPSVTDGLATYTCPAPVLPPTVSTTCTGPTHVVTQADVDLGSISNTATASGTRGGVTIPSQPATAVVTTVARAPALSIVKSVSPSSGAVLGTSLAYSFVVTNTGNVTVHGVGVTDAGAPFTCPTTPLAPRASLTCAGPTHLVTQADVDTGSVSNTATAQGLDPVGSAVVSAPSSVVVTFVPAPALTIVKSATRTSGVAVGDPITYSFAVTNTGNVTITTPTVTDAGVDYPCPAAPLAPNATVTCAGPTVVVTQTDVDTGTLTNIATVSGDPPTGPSITSPPSTVVITTVAAAPALSVVKSASPTGGVALGDAVTYSFTVTNTGNVSLGTPSVTDDTVVYPCPVTSLAPLTSITCAGPTRTVTQAQVDAGKVTNTAVASASRLGGGATVSSAPSTVDVPTVAAAGALTLLKSASPTSGVGVGALITYSFTVTNSGNVTVGGIAVGDAGQSYPCTPASLAPTQSVICAGPTHTVTQADVDLGSVSNTATAAGTTLAGATITSLPATAEVATIAPTPGLAVVKSSDLNAGVRVGNVITYSFEVTNTGNVSVGSVAVTDAGASYPCTPATLAPTEVATCAGPTHTVTQADVDAGRVRNTASAGGTTVTGAAVLSPSTTHDVTTVVAGPALAIVKSASPDAGVTAGDDITYSFVVSNIGNVTIGAIGVTDAGLPFTCPAAPLIPTASVTCTGPTHTVTQADVDHGSISNTATAHGTAPGPVAVTSEPSTVVVRTVAAVPQLTLQKSVTPSTGAGVGTPLVYSFLVTNTGNVTVDGVGVTDQGAPFSCPETSLAPQQSTTCTGPTHTVTQGDVDLGYVSNSATASGQDPYGATIASATSTVVVPIPAAPALSVVKSVTPSSGAGVGSPLTYGFTVRNAGNVTLTGVVVHDAGQTYPCPPGTLLPGASTTCAGPTHVVTQGDVDSGSISNTATASGTPPVGPAVTSQPSTVDVTFPPAPKLSLVKSVTPTTGAQVGTTLVYSFAVANEGNVTVDGVGVTDAGVGYTCLDTVLLPTQATTCTGPTHVVTQADVDAGAVRNTATASGTTPADAVVASDPSSVVVTLPAKPALTLVKSVQPAGGAVVGDVLTYSFDVANSGNVTLGTVVVTDAGVDYVCGAGTLAPGDQTTCAGPTHTVTQSDVDSGQVANTATAHATMPVGVGGGPVASDPATATVLFAAHAALAVVKTASPAAGVAVGDVITYSFAVTNIGNVSVGSILVSDGGTTYPCTPAALLPKAAATCAGPTHTVTQADVDEGEVTNTATASGADPSDATVTSAPATVRVATVVAGPGLAVVKSSDLTAGVGVGDVITYSFAVTNIGNVTVGTVTVTDAGVQYPCTISLLTPGLSTTCVGPSHTVTQADVDAGVVTNTASASGTGPAGAAVLSQPTTHDVTTVAAAPVLGLVKTADVMSGVAVGDVVRYTFEVTNDGDVTLHDVVVTDSGTAYPCAATLAPSTSATCAGPQHTVTQADVDAGHRTNTASAVADPPAGDPVSSGSSTVVVGTVAAAPRLTLVKSAGVTTGVRAGDTIAYTFTVTNSGNVTMSAVGVQDAGTTYPCAASTLAPGEHTTCVGPTRTVSQADVDTGSISNTAVADGTDPAGAVLASDPSTLVVTAVAAAPGLTLVKQASVTSGARVGDVVRYSFVVTNSGNVTMAAVFVVDDGVTYGCPATSLAPGASVTCAGPVHTITQADVDAGHRTNVASASGTAPDGRVLVSQESSVTTQTLAADPGGGLATTGTDDVGPILSAAVLALLLGAWLLLLARRRRES